MKESFSVMGAIVGLAGLIIAAVLVDATQDYPCDHYANWSFKNVPVRCISYFNNPQV